MRHTISDVLLAFQLLTRIPISGIRHGWQGLTRASRFFPVVGLVVGLIAAGIHRLLNPYLRPQLVALVLVAFLVLITGGLHEDGLADAVDGFGGGWTKEQILKIMRDSSIGSFGAIAVTLSLLARFVLIANISPARLPGFLVAASVLCRWTTLPLGFCLPYARAEKGLGRAIAGRIPVSSVAWGTAFALAGAVLSLGRLALLPWLITLLATAVSGWYFNRHIQGVTGDCFGATVQVTETAIYFYGAMLR